MEPSQRDSVLHNLQETSKQLTSHTTPPKSPDTEVSQLTQSAKQPKPVGESTLTADSARGEESASLKPVEEFTLTAESVRGEESARLKPVEESTVTAKSLSGEESENVQPVEEFAVTAESVRGEESEPVEEFATRELVREVESCNQLIEAMSARVQQGETSWSLYGIKMPWVFCC